MASSNFVPLPFFMDESAGDDKKKNDFGGQFGGAAPVAFNSATSFGDKPEPEKPAAEPSSTQLPTDFFSSSFTASVPFFSAPSNIEPAVAPVSTFDFGPAATETRPSVVNPPAAEAKPEATPMANASFNAAEPVNQSNEPAPVPTTFTGFTSAGFTSQPFGASSFEASQPWAPVQLETPRDTPKHEPWNQPTQPVATMEAAKQQEPWSQPILPVAPIKQHDSWTPPFTQPSTAGQQETWTPPIGEPWKPETTSLNQAVETAKVEEPVSHVSWQAPVAPRRSSIDSQRSNPPVVNTSVSAPPSISLPPYHHGLDALEETLSTRSFTNSSFVIEGGKACDRCAKHNELTANFCCRCGAQIGSPIESPSDSAVFSVDSSALVFEQMGRLSISEKPASARIPLSPVDQQAQLFNQAGFAQPGTFTQPGAFSQPSQLQMFGQPSSFLQQPAQFVTQAAAVSPTKPAPPSRIHPVMSFGFGGSFVLTFPTLQTRYNPNGQPINSYRPSMVYRGDIEMLPQAKAKMVESILAIDNGAPLLEKAQKPKELAASIANLKSDAATAGDKLLFGLFELILKSNGKPLDNPNVLDNLKELLAESLASEQHLTSQQSNHGSLGLNEVGQKVISGDIVGAAETAMNHQLWSHALLLGQFAGPQHYQKVVAQFVQQDFPPSHPVRLVYLMLSGQGQLIGQELAAAGPALTQSWAGTLLALVANRKSPIDNALLISLGDALAKSNDTRSSQFCYLLSHDETIFSSGRVKLIGTGGFVSVLRMTEAYEAVRYSMNPSFCLPHLFPLKMAFVSMLLELGLNNLALRHCNALGLLLKKSQWKDAKFLEAFDALVNRLEVFAEGNPSIAIPSADEGSGWFPKVGGLMDVLDRVIGVEDSGKSSPNKKSLKSPILPQVDVAAEPSAPSQPSYPTPVGGFDPFASAHGSFSAAPWEQIPQPVVPIKDATEVYLQKHENIEAAAPVSAAPLMKPEQPRSQAWSPTPEAIPAWAEPEVKQAEPTQSWQQPTETQSWPSQPWQEPAQSNVQPWQESAPPTSQPAWQPPQSQPWQPIQAGPTQTTWEAPGVPSQQQYGGPSQNWEAASQSTQGPSQFGQAPVQPSQGPSPTAQGPGQFAPSAPQHSSPVMTNEPLKNQPPVSMGNSPHLMHQASMPNLPSAADANTASTSVDDFGFANAPAVKRSETPTGTANVGDVPDADSNKDSDAGSKSSLLGGLLGGLFRRKQNASSPALSSGSAGSNNSNGPVKANLGESEMKLVYDEVKKQWVRKDTGAPPVAQAAAPPPPPSMGSQSASDSGSPMSYRRGQAGGARGKYVDAFGADSTTPAPSAPRVNLIPTPSFTNLSLEQPTQSAPQQQVAPQEQYHQSQQSHIGSQSQFQQGHTEFQGQQPQHPVQVQNQGQPPHSVQPQQQFQSFAGQSQQSFTQPPPQQPQQQFSYGNFNPTGPSGGPFYQ